MRGKLKTVFVYSQHRRNQAIAETLPVKDRIETNRITEKRSVVIEAKAIETIPTPADPYSYR